MASFENLPEVDCLLSCPICFNEFKEPKLLHCGHTFCLGCLEKLLFNEFSSIICPTCNSVTVKPENGLSGLRDDFRVNQIKDGIQAAARQARKRSQAKTKAFHFCGVCQSLATVRCLQCHQDLCEECLDQHNVARYRGRHTILRIGDVLFCDDHGKERSHVCRSCKCLVCSMCLNDKCCDHACVEITEAVHDYITSGQLKRDRDSALKTLANSAATEHTILEKFASIKQTIEKRSVALTDAIKIENNQLLSDLESMKKDALDSLEVSRRHATEQRVKLNPLAENKLDNLARGIPTELLHAVLIAMRPGVTMAKSQNRFLKVRFNIKQNGEDNTLGSLVFGDEKEPTAAHGAKVRGNTEPYVGERELGDTKSYIPQSWLGVACFVLFLVYRFNTRALIRGNTFSVEYLIILIIELVVCLASYCCICYFFEELCLSKVSKISWRIGKWISFFIAFIQINTFIYAVLEASTRGV